MPPLENVNVLLYVGAFLIVSSAGIFVGFNFTSVGAAAKTALVAGLAALFYGSGLALYRCVPKLRPAGLTFAGIGLVVAPLVGLAYYNFVQGAAGDAGAIWLLTSVVSLGLCVGSFAVMRQQYIAYFGVVSGLSLLESLIETAHLPVYYLAWGLVLASTLLALIARLRDADGALGAPLRQTSAVSAPLSALLSLLLVGEHGAGQLGVTALLAAVYLLAVSVMDHGQERAAVHHGAGLALIPLGLALVLEDAGQSRLAIALALLAVGAAYCALGVVAKGRWTGARPSITALLGGALLLGAAVVVGDQPDHAPPVLCAAAAIGLLAGLCGRYRYNLLAGVIAALCLPAAVTLQWVGPATPHSLVSGAYVALAAGLVGLRVAIRRWEGGFGLVATAGYVAALAIALGFAVSAGPGTILAVGLPMSIAAYALSYLESRIEFSIAAGTLLYGALAQLVVLVPLDRAAYAYLFTLAGVVVYAVALADRRGARTMRFTGIAGPLAGAVVVALRDRDELGVVVGLVVGAGLLLAEGRRQSESALVEAAGAVITVAIARLLLAGAILQTPVYADLAGAFFAWLAYRRHARGEAVPTDYMTALALVAVTLPTALSSLGDGGQADGLILTLESLLIILSGMALNYRLVRQWGVYVLVAEVVYQARTVILGLPWYVITAVLGSAFLAGAIWLLSRRSGDAPG